MQQFSHHRSATFNWKPLAGYFRSRKERRFEFRWDWCLAALLCAGVSAGTIAGVPPFSSLVNLSEDIRHGWEDPRGARGQSGSPDAASPEEPGQGRGRGGWKGGRGMGGGGGGLDR